MWNKGIFSLLFWGALYTATHAQNVPLYAVDPHSPNLYAFDTTDLTLNTFQTTTITSPIGTVGGCNGLAVIPCTGEFIVITKFNGTPGRFLAHLNPQTGVLLDTIGYLGDQLSGLAYDRANDVLYGITGDGAGTPETLFAIDYTNATMTQVMALSNGNDGEAICWSERDTLLYHFSGNCAPDNIFEKVDPVNQTVTPISAGSPGCTEVAGALDYSDDFILAFDINMEAILYDKQTGDTTLVNSTTPSAIKGLGYPLRMVWNAMDDTLPCQTPTLFSMEGDAYQWFVNGQPINGATNQSVSATQNGYYNCVVTLGGCSDSAFVGTSVITNPGPIADFSVLEDTIDLAVSGDAFFSDLSTGQNLIYSWDFGDGGWSNQASPTHTYHETDVYQVILAVSDGLCWPDSAFGTVWVIHSVGLEDLELDGITLQQNRPNPFVNHTFFEFSLKKSAQIQLEIFTLNGTRAAVVFEGEAPVGKTSLRWDGTNSEGAKLPAGAYFYRLQSEKGNLSRSLILLK